ncbi:MAG: hypothetical protein JO352_23860 [Chloroflexi bacterium]|nr:hypothetical protein [Chloroflexota bacterium]
MATMLEMISKLQVRAESGSAREAILLYDTQLPMTDVRLAEHFTVADRQTTRIRHIHDTAGPRTAGIGLAGRADG